MNGCPLMCANLCETKFATSFGKTPYKREVLKLGKLMGHMTKNDELQTHFDMIDFFTFLTSLFLNLKLIGVQLQGVTFRLPSQLIGVDGEDDFLDDVDDRGLAV